MTLVPAISLPERNALRTTLQRVDFQESYAAMTYGFRDQFGRPGIESNGCEIRALRLTEKVARLLTWIGEFRRGLEKAALRACHGRVVGVHSFIYRRVLALFRRGGNAGADRVQVDVRLTGRQSSLVENFLAKLATLPKSSGARVFAIGLPSDWLDQASHEPRHIRHPPTDFSQPIGIEGDHQQFEIARLGG